MTENLDRKALEKLASDSDDTWAAVSSDETTPPDPTAMTKLVLHKLDAVLAAQAVTARVLLRHDDWLERVGKVWDIARRVGNSKITWTLGAVLAARPEIVPDWLRELGSTLWAVATQ